MKKLLIASVLGLSIALGACGRDLQTSQKIYPTVGLLNQHLRSDNVCYEVSIGNVIWSVILIETVIFPVYFVGFSIFNPIREKTGPNDNCSFEGYKR